MSRAYKKPPEEFFVKNSTQSISIEERHDWHLLQLAGVRFVEKVYSEHGFYPEDNEIHLNAENYSTKFLFTRTIKNENFQEEMKEWKAYEALRQEERKRKKIKRQELKSLEHKAKEGIKLENIAGVLSENLTYEDKKLAILKILG